MSVDEQSSTKAYFSISENDDGSLWIYVSPQGGELKLAGVQIDIGLDLKAGISLIEASRLAGLLCEYVTKVSIWTID